MKALRFNGVGELRLEELDDPIPGPGEIRIRPTAVGICGTDVHIIDGSFGSRPPLTLGHEVAGFIEALGPGVRTAREGDLITVEPHRYCGACRYCRLGREHLCVDKEAFGVHLDGGMAGFQVIPERIAYRLPAGTDPRLGALVEPLSCCVHAMDRLSPVSGTAIAIFGAGPAGLMLIGLSKLAGLTPVVVMEPDALRRESARQFGADATIDPSIEGWLDEAVGVVGGAGYDQVVEAVGSGRVLEMAVQLAARQASILVFGVADPTDTAVIRPQEIFAKELTILGTVINPYTHHRAVELLPSMGLERLDVMTFPLGSYGDAFAAQAARRADKVQLAPQAS